MLWLKGLVDFNLKRLLRLILLNDLLMQRILAHYMQAAKAVRIFGVLLCTVFDELLKFRNNSLVD